MKPRSRLPGARSDSRPRLVRTAVSLLFLGLAAVFVWRNATFGRLASGSLNGALSTPLTGTAADAADAELARSLTESSWLGGGLTDPVHSAAAAVDEFVMASGQSLTRHPRVPDALASPASRVNGTLVVYVYAARDDEEIANFDYFLRFGVADDGAQYRIILTQGAGVMRLESLPQLPANARYVRPAASDASGGCPGSVWGALDAALPQLGVESATYVVVVDSRARGPFLPPYALRALHWTEVFTQKLVGQVHMVGSAVSCEGAPPGGDAAQDWRLNPHVLPYAWAVDVAGWATLRAEPTIWKCYANAWDVRYHGDVGAGLALLAAGHNLDCLLTRYQGVDWWAQANWRCNGRVSPDGELSYDGASATPYETLFVRIDQGRADNVWSAVVSAGKYSSWMHAQADGTLDVNGNAFTADPIATKSERLVYMNARGPGCFDFPYYLQKNPDLDRMREQPLELWEHFLLLGQFQGRTHRFSCPVQMGTSYRIAYQRARGHTCFDHRYYLDQNQDLQSAGLATGADLFGHYAFFGQFEGRPFRYTCPDTMFNFTSGFEAVSVKPEK